MGRVGYGVDAGDLNGDGWPEIIASNQDYNRLYIAWGSSARGFSSTSSVGHAGFPQGVTLIDLDRDGDLDVVTTLGAGWAGVTGYNCTASLTNDGAGGLSGGACWLTGNTYQKRALDLDGDGWDELLESGTGDVYSTASGAPMLSGSIDLGTISVSNQLHPYDADADGSIDIIAADSATSSLVTLLNDGSGAFEACDTSETLSYGPQSVGDLDADGDLDFVSSSTCSYCASIFIVGLRD
jgi:FG-GAP-like repeat